MSPAWPLVPLGEVASRVERAETPMPGATYRQLGVRLWGQGAYEREPLDGAATKYSLLSRTEAGDIVVNKIWARNGSIAVVPAPLSGCYVSSEFPTFVPAPSKLEPRWFQWFTKTSRCWEQCGEKSRGTSGKNRIKPERFLEIQVPLPHLDEQRHIVSRLEELSSKIAEAREIKNEVETAVQQMLLGVFRQITTDAEYRPMEEVAPIIRRKVEVLAEGDYPELGIRSFGKGAFHKPPLNGIEVGSKKLYRIEPGDIVFNNVFAWEGAVAVAKAEDAGRFGSHRFITCVPHKGAATADFLCFYFLTRDGLDKLGDASPGGAGRNRTLGLEALSKIRVPIPDYEKQVWFDRLQEKVATMKAVKAATVAELDALLPSILHKAFSGEL